MNPGLGRFGEAWARGYLIRNGYEILASNVHYRVGEIDIVARKSGAFIFVEVKCRRSSHFGSPLEAVTPSKLARLSRAVELYVQEHNLDEKPYQIDVIALEVDGTGAVAHMEHLEAVESPS